MVMYSQKILQFIKRKKWLFSSKICFFLFLGVDLKWKIAKKKSAKKQNFDFKSLFTIVIFKMFKNDKIWASKKCHYWHFLLFQNSEKAIFSAPLCSEKKSVHPLTHRGKLFLFFIFLLKVIEYFLLSFMAHW